MTSKTSARIAAAGFLTLVCVEAAGLSWITANHRLYISTPEWSSRSGYNDETVDAVAWLKARDGSFYRIEKDYPSSTAVIGGSFNDGLAQEFYGTTQYASFPQPAYAEFLAALGLMNTAADSHGRQLPGLGGDRKLMSLASVKYLLSKGKLQDLKKLASLGAVNVYQIENALPLGVTFDKTMPRSEFDKLEPGAKRGVLLRSVVVDDGRATALAGLREGPQEALLLTEHGQNALRGDIDLASRAFLFLSIPCDPGWTARVDGSPAALERADIGFMGLALGPGHHRVELDFHSPLRIEGALLSLAALMIYGLLLLPGRR